MCLFITHWNKFNMVYRYEICNLKGTVHPKMYILLFTHLHVIPNLYMFLSYVEHKWRYFEEPNNCWSPLTSVDWLPAFFKISSFMFSIRKTFIKVWNDMRVSEWRQIFHFWVNYPFKDYIILKWTLFNSEDVFSACRVRRIDYIFTGLNTKLLNYILYLNFWLKIIAYTVFDHTCFYDFACFVSVCYSKQNVITFSASEITFLFLHCMYGGEGLNIGQ